MSEHDLGAIEKNMKENYIELGRFVEYFELMVNEARTLCISMMTQGMSKRQKMIVEIPLYHQTLTAKPIQEIWRAVFIDLLSDQEFRTTHGILETDIKSFSGVLGTIAGEYGDLTSERNNLLHATWFMGYPSSDDPTALKFIARKHSLGGEGIRLLSLPETASELRQLSLRCDKTRTWMGMIDHCAGSFKAHEALERNFKLQPKDRKQKTTKRWVRIIQDGFETLP